MPKTKDPVKKSAQRPVKKVTPDDVWAGFDELRKLHAETEKAHKETEKALKETQRIVGDLGNKFGDIAEQMLTPALVEKFEQLTFPFTKISRNVRRKNKELGISMELDALLEDGAAAMVVEIKSKLNKVYVDDFIETMETVRRFADLDGDKRRFLGAMGAMTADEKIIKYVLDKGLYMIMPSGEDVKITKPVSEKFW